VRTDLGSDLTTECTKKKEEKGSERALTRIALTRIALTRIALTRISLTRISLTRISLTRISRKTRKDANEFLKIKKCSRDPCFFVLFVFPFLCGSVRFQWAQW